MACKRNILQYNVVTHLRCGGIFNNHCTTNLKFTDMSTGETILKIYLDILQSQVKCLPFSVRHCSAEYECTLKTDGICTSLA